MTIHINKLVDYLNDLNVYKNNIFNIYLKAYKCLDRSMF